MVPADNNSIQSPMRRAICKEVGKLDEPCQDIIQETEGTPKSTSNFHELTMLHFM